ncbi:MAG TPA: phytanoyl-CoA dioxygenase family protein [Burkholderiales bacterium]|nr:phytanoyl-CoA dioxygenase family protein [Burkholderiales bacterium]
MNEFSLDDIRRFRADGLVIVRGMADEATRAAILQAARTDLAAGIGPIEYEAELRYPGSPDSLDAPGGLTARRLLRATARHAVFREWALSAPVSRRLHQLMGPQVALVQAHHNCVMTKQPRYSSVTGWHQDIRYWSFERGELVSVWLALGPETPQNGCLSFIPGSHLLQIDRPRLDEALFLREDVPDNQTLIARRVTPLLSAGDVVFFHCRTFHSAGANRTDETKFSLVFTYHRLDDPPLPQTRSSSLPSVPVPPA